MKLQMKLKRKKLAFKASIKSKNRMKYFLMEERSQFFFSKFAYCLFIVSICVFDVIILKWVNLLLSFVPFSNRY